MMTCNTIFNDSPEYLTYGHTDGLTGSYSFDSIQAACMSSLRWECLYHRCRRSSIILIVRYYAEQ